MARSRMNRGGTVSLESLEARTLMAAPWSLASVGIRFDALVGPAVFLAEGTIQADNSMTGTMTLANSAGAMPAGPLDWTTYNRGPRGAFTFDTRPGFDPYASQTGTQFLNDDRWSLGSLVGRGGGGGGGPDGAVRDMATLAEPAGGPSDFETFAGTYDMQMARATATGIQYFSLSITVAFNDDLTASSLSFTYQLFGEFPPPGSVNPVVERHIVSRNGARYVLDGGEVLIAAGPQQGLLLADLDAADGIVGVASGRGQLVNPPQLGVVPFGRYRAAIVTTGPESLAFFGGGAGDLRPDGTAVLNVVIEISGGLAVSNPVPGDPITFRVYRQSEWDAGGRMPVTSGLWGQFLPQRFNAIAVDGSGREARFRNDATHGIFVDEVRSSTGVSEELFGTASQQQPVAGEGLEMLARADGAGHPIVYLNIHSSTTQADTLYQMDLVDEVGGQPVVGELITWSYVDSSYIAGLSSGGDVQIWRMGPSGWVYDDMTAAISGARAIAPGGTLAATRFDSRLPFGTFGERTQTLAGFDAEGKFVVYRQIPATGPIVSWEFINAERNGLDGGGAIPPLASALSGWGSTWDAAHFAALDTSGQVWSIWWAPGLEHWRVDNLSAAAGTVALVGNVTAVSTTWDSFQIAGTTTDGSVVVTWWAVERPFWDTTDLTALRGGGPALVPGTLTSNHGSSLANLNIVGADSGGRIITYWWISVTGWQAGDLTAAIPLAEAPLGPWRMVMAGDSLMGFETQSLLGHDAGGDLVRLIWRRHSGTDDWMLENVTDLALPYFT